MCTEISGPDVGSRDLVWASEEGAFSLVNRKRRVMLNEVKEFVWVLEVFLKEEGAVSW
jgi:hypothetical protein